MASDTIFALSSGRPPAAISIIRISGPGAHQAGKGLGGALPEARQAAVRQVRHPDSGELLDRALVLRFDAPASSTGEDLVELHCHGGRAVVEAVLGALEAITGLREAKPGEFTRRAFENGRIDLTEAEGLADLIEAETEAQRRAALRIAEGALSERIDWWRARLVELSARAEAAIDYVDEDSVDEDASRASESAAIAAELKHWLGQPRAEPLRDGLSVVIAGPPNAGKSSLLNALSGHDRAIVTDVPGTTRDHIEVPMSLLGVPVRLTDTAGLRESGDAIEQLGIDRARSLVERADMILWLGAPNDAPDHPRVIRLHGRCDLPQRNSVPSGSLAVSAVTGEGLVQLGQMIADQARGLLPAEGQLALNRRQAACVEEAYVALQHIDEGSDLGILAESLRAARAAFDRLTGRAGVEDVLDTLFARFCLGK